MIVMFMRDKNRIDIGDGQPTLGQARRDLFQRETTVDQQSSRVTVATRCGLHHQGIALAARRKAGESQLLELIEEHRQHALGIDIVSGFAGLIQHRDPGALLLIRRHHNAVLLGRL